MVWGQGIFHGINGLIDLNYNFYSSKTKDQQGMTTKIETNTYNPRFTLSINTNIFPKLRLDGGALFEKNISALKMDSEDTKTEITKVRPYFNLTLKDPIYIGGIGYSRREETLKTEGQRGEKRINEDYDAILGWRPEALPSIEARFLRTNSFDERRQFQDIKEDSIFLSSIYNYKGLGIRYQGRYADTLNKLNDLETKDFSQSGWLTYSDYFFNRRVSFNTSYNIARDDVEVKTKKTGGEVSFQTFPFSGLSILSDTPSMVTLVPNSSLIDGNLTASSGINIGLPPIGGDFRRRNIGIDFLNPTEVNQIFIWVDRELPSDIANSFSWDIYISSDNLNWTFLITISPAPFGPFRNRFELNFSAVKTRYIKVVTPPLSGTVPGAGSYPDIFITEIQAFNKKIMEEEKSIKTSMTSHIYSLDIRSRLLDIPILFYDLNYFYTKIDDTEDQKRYTLSNGLSFNHRFSRIFSASARIAREDGSEEDEKRIAYIYNASLEAVAFRTLTHRLVFSGRDEKIDKKKSDSNSIFIYNIAELYKGLEVNLNGGVNFSKKEMGEDIRDTTINFLTSIIPHPTMTISLDYSYTKTDQSKGGKQYLSTSTQRGDFKVSYNPLRTLFIVASIEIIAEKDKETVTTQNYGFNWSPFPEGNLQFRFYYNENIRSADDGKERVLSPGLRWNISRRSFLDVSYQVINSRFPSQKIDSNFFSANLKIFF